MLARYYKTSRTLSYLEKGPAGSFLDDFVRGLQQRGYCGPTIRPHVGAVHHLCCWAVEKDLTPSTLDDRACDSFLRHLSFCRCSVTPPGRFIHHARFSVPLFMAHLRQTGVLPVQEQNETAREPALVGFRHWMLQHRGVRESTLTLYDRVIPSLLATVNGDVGGLDARRLRAFLLQRSKQVSAGTAKNEAGAIRMFIRYLIGEGKAPAGLDAAVPTVARWRLAALPRHLSREEIDRLIAACDPSTKAGLRDRAIVLLLARLGLRASDVCRLRFADIDWDEATLRVSGKGRRAVRLPLSQEVGDAILDYLEGARPRVTTHRVFIRVRPPLLPLGASATVSCIVAAAMKRAEIRSPSPGAHLLRHSAATGMLQQGVSLQEIGVVLRHRSVNTTYHYAKVDVDLLRLMVQPWPEVASC